MHPVCGHNMPTIAIKRLRGVFTTRRYTNPRLPLPTYQEGNPGAKFSKLLKLFVRIFLKITCSPYVFRRSDFSVRFHKVRRKIFFENLAPVLLVCHSRPVACVPWGPIEMDCLCHVVPQWIMGAGSSMSRDARKQNKKIETTLRKDKLEQVNNIKLLLLGKKFSEF